MSIFYLYQCNGQLADGSKCEYSFWTNSNEITTCPCCGEESLKLIEKSTFEKTAFANEPLGFDFFTIKCQNVDCSHEFLTNSSEYVACPCCGSEEIQYVDTQTFYKNNKTSKNLDVIMDEMAVAICKYGDDHVELSICEEEDEFCIMYHSRHNSFGIGETYKVSDYGIDALIKTCDSRGFDYMEN